MQKFIEDVQDYQRNCVIIGEGSEEVFKDRIIFHPADELNEEEYFQLDLKGLKIKQILYHEMTIPGSDISSITFMKETKEMRLKYKRCGFTSLLPPQDKTGFYVIHMTEYEELLILFVDLPNLDGMKVLDKDIEFPFINYSLSGCTYNMKVFYNEDNLDYFCVKGQHYDNQQDTISHFLSMYNYFREANNKGFLSQIFSGEYDTLIIEINKDGEYSIGISPYICDSNNIVITINDEETIIDYDTFFKSIASGIWNVTLFKSTKPSNDNNTQDLDSIDPEDMPEGLAELLAQNGLGEFDQAIVDEMDEEELIEDYE